MNEHTKILNLEECLEEAQGLSGRVFGDRYSGIYTVKEVETEDNIPLVEGGIPVTMRVIYWDFRDRPPYERHFEAEEHRYDKTFPSDLLLMALQGLPSVRGEYIKGVLNSEGILVNK